MGTPIDAPVTSYSDTTPQKRAVTDLISMISPVDTPLIARFGIQSAAPSSFNLVNWPGTTVEWLEDNLNAVADLLDASITSTATTITVDDQSVFHIGDVLAIDSEHVNVTAHSATGQVLTVVRSFHGTTNASHVDDSVVTMIGNARLEGADADDDATIDITTTSNFTQIIQTGLKITRSQQKLTEYGRENTMEYQRMKKTKESLIKLERTLWYGVAGAGSDTVPRTLGGLNHFINSAGGNTVSAGGAVTQADFENALEAAYVDGGNPSIALVDPSNMQVIKNFYDASGFLQIDRTETSVGMKIQTVVTPFGDVELLMSRNMPSTDIPLIDADQFAILAFDPFFSRPLAISGDYEREELIGEFTTIVRHGLTAHAQIIAIS